MDLALLRTFLAVHRAGSFTRAGTLLGVSQPAVTGQIRTLERRLGRPLFLREARGVRPTPAGEELARRVASPIDALLRITEDALDEEPAGRTVHLAGPPEFTALRVIPALAPLVEHGLTLRAAFGHSEETLESLAAGHCDLALTTARPRGEHLTTTALCDEELVLVVGPGRADRLGGPAAVREKGPHALEETPILSVHESLPLMSRYWAAVFDAPLTRSGAVIVSDLRAVLGCVTAEAGMAVLPRYLCRAALEAGEAVALLEPPVPPLRTYFLSVRTGTLALPHLARAHEWLLRAAGDW